jgi:hypothetical protein
MFFIALAGYVIMLLGLVQPLCVPRSHSFFWLHVVSAPKQALSRSPT